MVPDGDPQMVPEPCLLHVAPETQTKQVTLWMGGIMFCWLGVGGLGHTWQYSGFIFYSSAPSAKMAGIIMARIYSRAGAIDSTADWEFAWHLADLGLVPSILYCPPEPARSDP